MSEWVCGFIYPITSHCPVAKVRESERMEEGEEGQDPDWLV